MKILITGGHLTPALSFIDFVQQAHPQDKLVFVGREFSQDAAHQKAVERYEVEKRKIPFIAFEAVRLGSGFFQGFFQHLTLFFRSLTEAKAVLQKQKPQLVLSFGGYMAVPFSLAAWQLRIPVITHEQTFVSGFANTMIGLVASKIAVSFPDSTPKLLFAKTVLTGNPLRAGVFRARHARPAWLSAKSTLPIILVLGGNQGSRALNIVIEQSLPELLKDWVVVHQCGKPMHQHDSKEILERQRNRLSQELRERYFIHEWIDDEDLFWLYQHAFCAVSRSGANATQELAAARLPAVLIPLPTARRGEQQRNAEWLASAGGAMILRQSALNTDTLLAALRKLKTFEQPMRESLARVSLPENAAERLYTVAMEVASGS